MTRVLLSSSPDSSLTSPGTFRELWLLDISQGRPEGSQHGRADESGFEMFQTCWICRGHSSPAASSRKSSLVLCRKKLKSELHVRVMKWLSGETVSDGQSGRHWEFVYLLSNSLFIFIIFCGKMMVSLHLKAKQSISSIQIKFSVQTLLLLFLQHPCLQAPGQGDEKIQ